MIFASILAKLAMPPWLAKLLAIALGAFLVIALLIGYRRHLIDVGVQKESARRDQIDEVNRQLAVAALARLNQKVAVAQEVIDSNTRELVNLERKFDREKATSATLQSRLASGADRLRVQIAPANPARTFDGPGVAELGAGTGDFAYLSPGAGAWLERLRSQHNEAADRLDACISAYDAVKLASDRLE